MFYKIFISTIFLFASFSFKSNTANTSKIVPKKLAASNIISNIDNKIQLIYNSLQANQFQLPKEECFAEALKGFYAFKEKGAIKRDILTLVDFSLSSNSKRL